MNTKKILLNTIVASMLIGLVGRAKADWGFMSIPVAAGALAILYKGYVDYSKPVNVEQNNGKKVKKNNQNQNDQSKDEIIENQQGILQEVLNIDDLKRLGAVKKKIKNFIGQKQQQKQPKKNKKKQQGPVNQKNNNQVPPQVNQQKKVSPAKKAKDLETYDKLKTIVGRTPEQESELGRIVRQYGKELL